MYDEIIKIPFQNVLSKLNIHEDVDIIFEYPKNPSHGDLSTNIAMQLAGKLKKQPRQIAQEIINTIEYDKDLIEKIDIAGAGFINIKFSNKFYTLALKNIYENGENFGKSNKGKGIRVNVEYVSVNPTGLLHLGHGRNACIGDTIANLYEWMGYDVTREYYFNNAGNQMNNLAKSIYARYRQQLDNPDFLFPVDGYHGDYIKEIADELINENSNKLLEDNDENLTTIRKFGENWCFGKIKKTLERMSIHQEVYYNEDSLYSEGKIKDVIGEFKEKDIAYEKDGALWLALTKMGLTDDRVIVKSTGEPTYRLPDIAYHREKFLRGFDILIDIFGSDHIATVPDVLAGVKALGFDPDKVKVYIHQFVTLTENGEQIKMSKRTGKNYTLDDLLDEVGSDVVRFFLLMRGISTHLEFDLALAREQSEKNPVFYLQYAHARLCSVFDNAELKGVILNGDIDFHLLQHETEIKLIKQLLNFPGFIESACNKGEPQVLADYLRELASAFHVFYHECRILDVGEKLSIARLALAKVTMFTMKNGLTILGISAPTRM
ncbi:MAG: arginine--tRNA ligase [Ignavibacteria bacterium GWB2_35_12]|nr:MAG: arginine--tRNA ligase [Ignavibacteria bacterium GWA2_35_8]OGU40327.1 MAG: arginine--tRNA ligase [Ignavibacteria bacterium GWB2_35_12]OGU93063.1 MAG: arginine--tRNA ligase [Ignavibacteria bacterium RIFOXYA2_FULL_35_10]OGV24755.1 MAG: arginine--tRNA ligase [Ignavibacteria bacterium RIFOXYC2_FULL_35_21]